MENKWEIVRDRIIRHIESDDGKNNIVSWDKDSIKIGDVDFDRFYSDEKYIPAYEYKLVIKVELDALLSFDPNRDHHYKIVTI